MTTKKQPHAKDLRKGRYSENKQIYLITTVTHQRQKIFNNFTLGRIVVQSMKYQHQQQNINSLAFVIMPDHIHWLFALQNNKSLAEIMKNVKGQSAYKIQKIRRKQSEITGNQPLWQDGYYDHAIRKEEDLQKMARYIVANPLRANIVKTIADYPLWDAIWL